jgi:hypothetical protein
LAGKYFFCPQKFLTSFNVRKNKEFILKEGDYHPNPSHPESIWLLTYYALNETLFKQHIFVKMMPVGNFKTTLTIPAAGISDEVFP